MKKIFVPVVGQFINIGDVLHRRELLSWLRDQGELHIYVGKAPKSFIDGLKLDSKAILYTSISSWMIQILVSGYKKTFFIFNPGEIRLEKRRLLREILLFPLLCVVRLKKGKVLRVGIAAMSEYSNKNLNIWKLVLKTTNKIFWRTYDSKEKFKRGVVIPDLAFYDVDNEALSNLNRPYLTISMRGNHASPSDKWYDIIKGIALKYNLEIVTVSQVRNDNDKTLQISEKLNAKKIIWKDNYSHNEQEAIVNEIYQNSLLIVSDRLHALILAYSKGAIPINLLTVNKEKVQHHFDVIGIDRVNNIIGPETEIESILEYVEDAVNNKVFYLETLHSAKARLEKVKKEIQIALS